MSAKTAAPTGATLADIEADARALGQMLDEMGGEITPETEGIIDGWFAELDRARSAKVDGYAWRIKSDRADAAHYKALADELRAKAKTAEARADWLMRRMERHLDERGETEVQGAIYAFAFQKNGGKAPLSLESENPFDFPPDCRTETTTINKEAVRARLERGETTWTDDDPFVDDPTTRALPAAIGERGRSLRLK